MEVKLEITNFSKFILNIFYVIINLTQIFRNLHRFASKFQQISSEVLENLKQFIFLKFSQISASFRQNVFNFVKTIY